MKRWKNLTTTLAVASLLVGNLPLTNAMAQVAPNAPIEMSVDILLQVQATQPKRQANASYEILNEAGEVVYRHISDQEVQGSLNLAPGKYRLRLYDTQNFQRDGKTLAAQKVEQSIPTRNEQEKSENKKVKELENKGKIQTSNDGKTYYEVAFTVEAGPDLENADHTKMEAKLAVYLGESNEQPAAAPNATDRSATPAANEGSVQFSLVDEAGQAVANAVVQFEGKDYTSDANGVIRIEKLAPADYHYQIKTLPADYEGELSDVVTVQANQNAQIKLTVKRRAKAHNLTIKVVNEAGEPVAQVGVAVQGQTLTTDQQGEVTIPNVAPGDVTYQITSVPDGYVGDQTGALQMGDQDAKAMLTLPAKAKPAVKRQLTLTVLDNEQHAVSGAKVKLNTEQEAVTDAKGQAVFAGLEPGFYAYELVEIPDGYTNPNAKGTVEVGANEDGAVNLTLTKVVPPKPVANRQVTVTVVDNEQKAVSGAEVQLNDQHVTTDAKGQAVFKEVVPGIYKYAITSLPTGYTGEASGTAELPADQDGALKLAVEKVPATKPAEKPVEKRPLTVKVYDNTQQAVAGVKVKVNDQMATTDENGRAVFKEVTPGQFTYEIVEVPADYTANQKGTAELPTDTDHSITLTVERKPVAKATVTLTVVDGQQQGVAGAEVYLGGLKGTTDANGAVVFSDLEPGKYTYGIQKAPEHYQIQSSEQALNVTAGATLSQTLNVVRQVQAAQLTLTVVNVNGEPIANVALQAAGKTLQTDSKGQVTFSDLQAGEYEYQVTAVPEGYQLNQAKIKVALAKGQTLQRTIQLVAKEVAASSSQENIVATKKTAVESKKGLPKTGEVLTNWVIPTGLVLVALAAGLVYRRKQSVKVDNSDK